MKVNIPYMGSSGIVIIGYMFCSLWICLDIFKSEITIMTHLFGQPRVKQKNPERSNNSTKPQECFLRYT